MGTCDRMDVTLMAGMDGARVRERLGVEELVMAGADGELAAASVPMATRGAGGFWRKLGVLAGGFWRKLGALWAAASGVPWRLRNTTHVQYITLTPTSFRVVLLGYDDSRVRANVFSSETGKGSVLPWVDVPAGSDTDGRWLQNDGGLQANGFLYWVYEDRRYLISLDTSTMEFSVAELPHCLRLKQCSFDIGETKDGATCIVYSDQLNVGILILTRDDDGVQRWVMDRIVRLDTELERVLQDGLEDDSGLLHLVDTQSDLIVFAVQEGYAYFVLVTSVMDDAEEPRWFLSLCLDWMKLERLFRRTLDSDVYPYIMAWPPSLVGNYGQFALKDAPSNA
ncbi:hypothetical protein EJB05_53536, partial [Eragrostis curvula]